MFLTFTKELKIVVKTGKWINYLTLFQAIEVLLHSLLELLQVRVGGGGSSTIPPSRLTITESQVWRDLDFLMASGCLLIIISPNLVANQSLTLWIV